MQEQNNGEIRPAAVPGRERRRWKRFMVDGAYTMVIKPSFLKLGKPSYVTLGPIKNIGMKGLAMHYVEKNNRILQKVDTLSIMFPGEGIIVDNIPFSIVNDFEVAEMPNNSGKVRNLCISFNKILPMQKVQLERFISKYGNELET